MPRTSPLPKFLRQNIPQGPQFFDVVDTLKTHQLNTVCEEAKCPNRTHCYARGTLTFQILGSICTRRCGFCAEKTGIPLSIDQNQPQKILEATRKLQLKHVVITAPARDDLPDGGAQMFAQTVSLLKGQMKNVTVEVLTSDFMGDWKSLKIVLDSEPDIFNHNIETVERLTPKVRAKATYSRSMNIFQQASKYSKKSRIKSGLMVGLGETWDEIVKTLQDLRNHGVEYLTVGQYLQPSFDHLMIEKYYSPEEFSEINKMALSLGFSKAMCGPLVRSSYHAEELNT